MMLRADVEKMLAERARDLERQLALLGNESGKRRGRPPGGAVRASTLKGSKVPPRYRGPGGETWAGRGAKPRWLTALLGEGHSTKSFLSGPRAAKHRRPVRRDLSRRRAGSPQEREGGRLANRTMRIADGPSGCFVLVEHHRNEHSVRFSACQRL